MKRLTSLIMWSLTHDHLNVFKILLAQQIGYQKDPSVKFYWMLQE